MPGLVIIIVLPLLTALMAIAFIMATCALPEVHAAARGPVTASAPPPDEAR